MVSKKKKYGQYFTPKLIADFMVDKINKKKNVKVLEPSAGKGVFLQSLKEKGFENITAYEIDETLDNESSTEVEYRDFLKTPLNEKFDVIIGNPPYSRWKNIPSQIKNQFEKSYWDEKINGLSDLLYAFIFKSIDKLKEGGELIFITPTFWIQTLHSTPVRKYVYNNGSLELIVTFDEMKICKGASTMFMIFKLIKQEDIDQIKIVRTRSKTRLNNKFINKINDLLLKLEKKEFLEEKNLEGFLHPQFNNGKPWNIIHPDKENLIDQIENCCINSAPTVKVRNGCDEFKIELSKIYKKHELRSLGYSNNEFESVKQGEDTYYKRSPQTRILESPTQKKIEKRPVRLGDVAEIGNGLVSGLDKAFRIEDESKYTKKEKEKFIKVIKAADLERYYFKRTTPYLFLNDIKNENLLKEEYPNAFSKLVEFKDRLENRYDYNKNIPWWHWVFLRNWDLIKNSKEKILTPCKERINNRGYARFSYAKGNYYNTQDVTVMVKKERFKMDTKYLVGILNSQIIFEWLKEKGLKRGGVLEFSEKPLSRIPIKMIDWDSKKEVNLHDEIVGTVNKVISSKKVNGFQKRIDELVEKLYEIN